MSLNLSNKIAILLNIKADKKTTCKGVAVDVQVNGERVETKFESVKVVRNKAEAEQVTKLVARAHAKIKTLTAEPLPGLHVCDKAQESEVRTAVELLAQEARDLSGQMVECTIAIGAAYCPIDLEASAGTADMVREHVRATLDEVRARLTAPDTAKPIASRYSDARNALAKCAHIHQFASGVNAGAVIAGVQEAAELCKYLRKPEEVMPPMPALDAAISLFEPDPGMPVAIDLSAADSLL